MTEGKGAPPPARGHKGLRRLAAFLGTALLLWGIYALSVSLGFVYIYWVYVGLFPLFSLLYVLLVRGHLSPPPKEPPAGIAANTYDVMREQVLAWQRRYRPLLDLAVGTLLSLLLDYVNLVFFDGAFL